MSNARRNGRRPSARAIPGAELFLAAAPAVREVLSRHGGRAGAATARRGELLLLVTPEMATVFTERGAPFTWIMGFGRSHLFASLLYAAWHDSGRPSADTLRERDQRLERVRTALNAILAKAGLALGDAGLRLMGPVVCDAAAALTDEQVQHLQAHGAASSVYAWLGERVLGAQQALRAPS